MQDSNFSVSVPGIQWILLAVFIVWILLMGFIGWRKGILGSIYFNLSWLTFFFLSFTVEPYVHEPLHDILTKAFSSMGDIGEFIAAFVASFIFFVGFVFLGMLLMAIIYHFFVHKAVRAIRNYYHKKHSWFWYTNAIAGTAIGVVGGAYTFTMVNNISSVVIEDADESPIHDFLTTLYSDIPFLGNVEDLHGLKDFATDALNTFDGIQETFEDALGPNGIVSDFLNNPDGKLDPSASLDKLTDEADKVGKLIDKLAGLSDNAVVGNLLESSPEVKNSIKGAISEPLDILNQFKDKLPDPSAFEKQIDNAESQNKATTKKVLGVLPGVAEGTADKLERLLTGGTDDDGKVHPGIYPKGDPQHDAAKSLTDYLAILERVESAAS